MPGNPNNQLSANGGIPVFFINGSSGTDYSGGVLPVAPSVNGTTFTFNGALLNLLVTIPVFNNRKMVEVMNVTGATAVVVLDDGINGNISYYPLTSSVAYTQGGDWNSLVEYGRVRVFGAATGYVFARSN